jgi:hypothetical protein
MKCYVSLYFIRLFVTIITDMDILPYVIELNNTCTLLMESADYSTYIKGCDGACREGVNTTMLEAIANCGISDVCEYEHRKRCLRTFGIAFCILLVLMYMAYVFRSIRICMKAKRDWENPKVSLECNKCLISDVKSEDKV